MEREPIISKYWVWCSSGVAGSSSVGEEADAVERLLGHAVDLVGDVEADGGQDRRHQVDGMGELAAHRAGVGDAAGPVHDQGRAGPAEPGVALPELVGRVAGPGPGPGVVVVGAEPAPVVVVGEVVVHGLPEVRGEAVLVDAAGHAPLGAGAVVGEDHDERVVECARGSRATRGPGRSARRCGSGSRRRPPAGGRACAARRPRGRPRPAPTRAAR